MRCLAILLICVPVQLILTFHGVTIENYIYQIVSEFQSKWYYFIQSFSDFLQSWTTENENESNLTDTTPVSTSTSKIREDFYKSYKVGVRMKRPENLILRVGNVVLNLKAGYTGVIIGWRIDEDENEEPVYTVLVDDPEVNDYKAEANQSDLFLLPFIQVFHPELLKYFDWYDGRSQYKPKLWLRYLYPHD